MDAGIMCILKSVQGLIFKSRLLSKMWSDWLERSSFVLDLKCQKNEDSTKSGGTYLNINGRQRDHVYIKALCTSDLFSSKLSRISSGDEWMCKCFFCTSCFDGISSCLRGALIFNFCVLRFSIFLQWNRRFICWTHTLN